MTQGLRDLSILGRVSRDQHTLFSLLVVAEMPHLPGSLTFCSSSRPILPCYRFYSRLYVVVRFCLLSDAGLLQCLLIDGTQLHVVFL
jgi:hypothetical protein